MYHDSFSTVIPNTIVCEVRFDLQLYQLDGMDYFQPLKYQLHHFQIDAAGAVGLQVQQRSENRGVEPGLAVRGQSHHLIFTRIYLKAGKIRKSRVQQAQ